MKKKEEEEDGGHAHPCQEEAGGSEQCAGSYEKGYGPEGPMPLPQ